jgi:hypothetical protein
LAAGTSPSSDYTGLAPLHFGRQFGPNLLFRSAHALVLPANFDQLLAISSCSKQRNSARVAASSVKIPTPVKPSIIFLSRRCVAVKATFAGKDAPPFPRCNRPPCRRFPLPILAGPVPAPQRPAPTCARACSNKEADQFSSFVKCPRFKQRAWQRRKNPSRVSAFASMNAHPTRALDGTFRLRPLKEP